jgi:TolB-like protein/DNA-binding winged helix-turn-helix (wHTH) protein/Tfp pilus assembly protein PilF
MSLPKKEIFEFGDHRLDVDEHSIERLDGAQTGRLPDKSFQILVLLLRRRGHLVSKDEILEAVWPDTVVEEGNLDKRIHHIRQFLGENADRKFIETVRKHGYRFVGDVRVAEVSASWLPGSNRVSDEETDEINGNAPAAEHASAAPTPVHPRSSTTHLFLIAALALIGLATVLLLGFNAGGIQDRLFSSEPALNVRSIAVLPFDDLSGDTGQDYFANGITDALITELGGIESLRVIARQSVMQYKGAGKSPRAIASELNVDALLTGSVARSGDRVRIAIQMVDPRTEHSVWTQSYDRSLRDALSLQQEVTRDIAAKIRSRLREDNRTAKASPRTVEPEAYDQYLRGKYYLNFQTRDNNQLAINALQAAVTADPNFAAAHAELAQAYIWKLFLFSPEERDLAERAYVETEKALTLDPELAVAYLARGRLLWTPANRFPHEQSIREYKRALELDPNLDEARNQLALVYCHIGAFEPAQKELQQALASNPGNSVARFRIGEARLFQGNYEEALSVLQESPKEANPALVQHFIVWALLHLDRTSEAAAMLDKFQKENPEDNRGLLTSERAVIDALAGRHREATANIQLAIKNGKDFGHFHHSAYYIACAYAVMNDRDEAIKWLEFAAKDGFPVYPTFENDRFLSNLHGDPRFISLIASMREKWGRFQNGG